MSDREEGDLISCDKCENLIDDDDEAIENHSCGSPYYICMTCHEKSYF